MDTLFLDGGGRVATVFSQRVDEEDRHSLHWTGLNKHCSVIPGGALDYIDRLSSIYHHEPSEFDEFGRYVRMEWMDQPDWFDPEHHYRGWIPLRETDEQERRTAFWSRDTKTRLNVVEVMSSDFPGGPEIEERFRRMQEEIGESALYNPHIPSPALFDIEKVDLAYTSAPLVQVMVAEARRSVLEMSGHLIWWTTAVPGWSEIWDLNLNSMKKVGFLISPARDWTHLNFPLLIKRFVPLFYIYGDREHKDKRFTRLNPDVIHEYVKELEKRDVTGLWEYELPPGMGGMELKISPYVWSRPKVPVTSEMSGTIKYWCIDFQHWARRELDEDEDWKELAKLYHHLVTQSAHDRVTHVIFHRFHPLPKAEVMNTDGTFGREELAEPDLCAIRECFKGGYAPRLGEVFDNETGIERRKGLNTESTLEDMVEQKERELLVDAPPHLGGRTKASWREVGPRMTSPNSDHSSERRVEDYSTPMAYESGWADAMMRDDWMDPINHYIPNRNARLPRYHEDFDDARSHVSISSESSRESREHTYSRRSASPELRGHRVYPVRCPSPPLFAPSRHETYMKDLQARRVRWLNNFADWGREATYESSLWRIPCENRWNPDVLALGYLIVSEVSEFKMRPDCEDRTSRGVTKAMVDRHNKGPRLNPSPSMADVVQQYKANLGQIGLRPHAPCIIARGGVPSWILRAYLGVGHVAAYMEGPSMQISVHRDGANDSADRDGIDVTWDELSEGDYLAMSGLISGRTLKEDLYLYPTDAMLMEFSDHYYGEWNPFCDKTFERLKRELDSQRARGRTRSEWKKYFQSSNHGREAPPLKVTQRFIEEGLQRLDHAFGGSWNKKKICDIFLPEAFRADF
ncbi:hypothetical protein B0H14DRAFT_2597201 [Mycena olivaceomarginata]|nr:hypothetical protein B0H14DRAFT_2597201 [Mycena olivaceomarginata]